MSVIIAFIFAILRLLIWVIFGHVILTWLFQLNVISHRNEFFSKLYQILNNILDPFYSFIRRYVPPLGNIDTAPLVLLLGIYLLQYLLVAL